MNFFFGNPETSRKIKLAFQYKEAKNGSEEKSEEKSDQEESEEEVS